MICNESVSNFGCWLAEQVVIVSSTNNFNDGQYTVIESSDVLSAAYSYVKSLSDKLTLGQKISVKDETGYIHNLILSKLDDIEIMFA